MAKPATMTNQFHPDTVNPILQKIDGYNANLESERGTYMQKCRGIRESIDAVYEQAKAQGIPAKELRVLVKIRKNEARNQKLFAELEGEQQQTLAMLAATEKVKDLPLWRAAEFTSMSGTTVDGDGRLQHAQPMFTDNDPQGLRHANFKPL